MSLIKYCRDLKMILTLEFVKKKTPKFFLPNLKNHHDASNSYPNTNYFEMS